MRIPHNYILVGQTPVLEPDVIKWAQWFETAEQRVRLTRVGKYKVSTVFLGLDHRFHGSGPPIVFETMIFTRKHEAIDYQKRCATWREAERQHEEAIAYIAKLGDKPEQIYPVPLTKLLKARGG
jgi:hypothetical protein